MQLKLKNLIDLSGDLDIYHQVDFVDKIAVVFDNDSDRFCGIALILGVERMEQPRLSSFLDKIELNGVVTPEFGLINIDQNCNLWAISRAQNDPKMVASFLIQGFVAKTKTEEVKPGKYRYVLGDISGLNVPQPSVLQDGDLVVIKTEHTGKIYCVFGCDSSVNLGFIRKGGKKTCL